MILYCLYQCEGCCFGSSNGATGESVTRHLKGVHNRGVNVSLSGFFYCNDCNNGNGRRFHSFEDLLKHFEDWHSLDCITVHTEIHDIRYECDTCGFGSSNGATAESITRHLKGSHYLEVNVTSSGTFFCNDCGNSTSGKRFEFFEELLEHLEDRRSLDCIRKHLDE